MGINQRAPAWSSVNAFYTYVTKPAGIGPRAVVESIKPSTDRTLVNFSIGDITQIDYNRSDNRFDHNVIITGLKCGSDGKFWPSITGRSGTNCGIELAHGVCLIERYPPLTNEYRVLRFTTLG